MDPVSCFPDKSLVMEHYDAIIIGSGQAGNPLAVKFAVTGHRVALVEREHIGGSCVNVGCSPSKTMEASAHIAHLVERANDYGVMIPGPHKVDMEIVRQRKRHIVKSFSKGDQAKLLRKGVRIIWGEAKFTAPGVIEVTHEEGGTQRIAGDRIFIDTGTRPAVPDIDGLPCCSALTNETIMELDTIPDHLVVIGGGYVGLEFGRMFRSFGSDVTIIHRDAHVLSGEDRDVAEAIQDLFREDGIKIILNAQTHKAMQDPDGTIHLKLVCPDGHMTVTGSHLLVATGRTPNSDMLNLSAAGIRTDENGYIMVDRRLQTSAENVFALGDIKGGPAFTHIAYDDYRIMRTNLFESGDASTDGRILPYVVFLDPQLGRIGLSEQEAVNRGLTFEVVKMPMTHVARALEVGETSGFMKALLDTDSGKILGFACLGLEAGELMAVVQVAMAGGLTWRDLKEMIFAHPTIAESLNNLFSLAGRGGK